MAPHNLLPPRNSKPTEKNNPSHTKPKSRTRRSHKRHKNMLQILSLHTRNLQRRVYNNQLLYTKNEKRCSSVERNQIVMSYDRKADVIYISFGKPRKAVSEEIDPYVLVRRDPKTKEILGITITNFTKYFETQKKLNIKVPAS